MWTPGPNLLLLSEDSSSLPPLKVTSVSQAEFLLPPLLPPANPRTPPTPAA